MMANQTMPRASIRWLCIPSPITCSATADAESMPPIPSACALTGNSKSHHNAETPCMQTTCFQVMRPSLGLDPTTADPASPFVRNHATVDESSSPPHAVHTEVSMMPDGNSLSAIIQICAVARLEG